MTPPLVRICAGTAPAFLLLYGILRLIDGLDGYRGPGPARNLGHAMFLAAMVLFGILSEGLRRWVEQTTPRKRVVAGAATAAALFGVSCFLWVILGDLFAWFRVAAPLPDPLAVAGQLLFPLGLLTLLVLLVTARPRRVPIWAPPVVLLGMASIAVDLDLLPIGALLVGLGLAPLAVTRSATATPRTEPLPT